MLGTLFFLLPQAIYQTPVETPNEIVTKMMSKYAYADSLSGTIVQTYSDGQGKVTVKTDVKYVRDQKLLFLEQDRKGRNGLNHKVVSDGLTFMYPPPVNTKVPPKPDEMLYEAVTGMLPGTRITFSHDLGYIYNVAHMSIVPSITLDLAVGYLPHLKDFKIHVATVDSLQAATYKGKPVHKITGDWRLNRSTLQANGRYELLVSSDYDVLKLTYTSVYSDRFGGANIKLTTTEVVDLTVDSIIDTKVFNIRKKDVDSQSEPDNGPGVAGSVG